jgi:hypothetical protein
MVLRGNRSFVLTTFGAQGHAMNGERSAIPYQFWFSPAACQQCWREPTSQEGHAALTDNGALIVYEVFIDDSRRKTWRLTLLAHMSFP